MCPDEWYPGQDDSCDPECGLLFEHFWDECGVILTNADLGGMDEMGNFYNNCLGALYPPGSCGTFCNEHTCKLQQPRKKFAARLGDVTVPPQRNAHPCLLFRCPQTSAT